MRQQFPKGYRLDILSASPQIDPVEWEAMWKRLAQEHPDIAPFLKCSPSPYSYVGCLGRTHYFQEWGTPIAFTVQASEGWTPRPPGPLVTLEEMDRRAKANESKAS